MQNLASSVIESPRQDAAAEPVDDCGQIDEAARHGNVGDVHRPDLVGPDDGEIAQQIGIDLVPRRRLRGVGAAVERLDVHLLHERSDVTPAHAVALRVQEPLQHPASRERVVEMQFVDPAHQRQIGGWDGTGQVVDAAPADPQNACLAGDRKSVTAVDHFLALSNPALLSAPAKKSFSSASSPILA